MPYQKIKKRCRCDRTYLRESDFEEGIKTCNFCREQKALYLKTERGKKLNKKAQIKYHKTEKGKISLYNNNLRMFHKYPYKFRAKGKVYYALKTGKIKKEKCFCGNKKTEGHHIDYNNPLLVERLCLNHHFKRHYALLYSEKRE